MRTVFLHGLGQTPDSWDQTVKSMNRAAGALCPDLSRWVRGKEVCYAGLYQGMEEYCGSFQEPVNLCGLSLGGVLALNYALEHPERVDSLALIGAQFKMPRRLLQIQNAVFRVLPSAAFPQTGFGKADFIALSKSMLDLDFQPRLAQLRCRTLVVCGEKDRANQAAALQLKEGIPNASLLLLADAGHEVNLEQPAQLAQALDDFFAQRPE